VTGGCRACGGEVLLAGDSAGVDDLAVAWARQGAFRDLDAAGVERLLVLELGADRVAFLRCRVCGVERADPPRAWSAERYPREPYGIGWDHLHALDRLRAAAPLRLLEIGCAEGAFLERAAALGHVATGIDFSSDAVSSAVARGLDARVGTAEGLEDAAGGEPFGAIALFQVIEHLPEPASVLAALARRSSPGGLLFVGCPAPGRYSRRVPHRDRVGDSDFWDWPPQHVLRWTPAGLRRILARHGWRSVRIAQEPLDVVGAAAHLAAIDGIAGGWYESDVRRRAATALHRVRLAGARLRRRLTGTRMLAVAVREER
jgi:2-polyprenyl-3-methyl-5-hydroxy-6-metoxy-1,4-benzoquinol methylase